MLTPLQLAQRHPPFIISRETLRDTLATIAPTSVVVTVILKSTGELAVLSVV